MKFVALNNFHSEELQSNYCAGLIYTVRPEVVRNALGDVLGVLEPEHSLLAKMVKKWSAERPPLVRVLDETEGSSEAGAVAGSGTVS
jgi:hypothetical protein